MCSSKAWEMSLYWRSDVHVFLPAFICLPPLFKCGILFGSWRCIQEDTAVCFVFGSALEDVCFIRVGTALDLVLNASSCAGMTHVSLCWETEGRDMPEDVQTQCNPHFCRVVISECAFQFGSRMAATKESCLPLGMLAAIYTPSLISRYI